MPQHIPAAPLPHLGDQMMLKNGRRHILLYNGPCPHDDSGAYGEFVFETTLLPYNAVSLAYECVVPASTRLEQLMCEGRAEIGEDFENDEDAPDDEAGLEDLQ